MQQRSNNFGGMTFLLWCALALQLGAQLALGSVMPATEDLLRRQTSGTPIPKLPVCVPPQVTSPLTGNYPKSAVTTVQTGTNCNQYGNPPARVLSDLESPNGLQDYIQICHGQILTMTDRAGQKRAVCFYANPKSTKDKPLPLLVYLHPSLAGTTITFPLTGIDGVRDTQSLNNEDPSRLGFSYILPAGRNTVHQYPIPDDVGLGWDNWYRNLDRSSPELNIDVDFIDKTIAYAKANVPVDSRRVFMTGWSNGASMAELYAANTDGIASAAVYSAPDPFRDSQDPCTQVSSLKYATPVRDVHNYCDILGICTTGKYYHDDLKKRYPSLPQSIVVIDVLTAAIKSQDANAQCNPACQGPCGITTGTLGHLRWPVSRNSDTFFAFMRNNPLPASGTWGPPK
ncbi:conserved hypothetical Ustilaginaceae-specific protein [Ustilago trichophora]|uniref:Conserved hypothetical Ustilaginaceae-specific protein n=1 Tax=Ustilago trichophora TaxID=86804 RepID=A0A5C3E6H8_9BASI|nr:conserved hypothetical Ustilaginaceae-specific protein [Ustilago trichophora]